MLFNSSGPAYLSLLPWCDSVSVLFGLLAVVLLAFDRLTDPFLGALVVSAFLAWRAVTTLASRGVDGPLQNRIMLAKEVGSLLLAGYFSANDSAEILFFSLSIILGWQALTYPLRWFKAFSVVALVGYVGIVTVVGTVSADMAAQFGFLVVFCATLGVGKAWVESYQRNVGRVRRDLSDGMPFGLAVATRAPHRMIYVNSAAQELRVGEIINRSSPDGESLRRLVDTAIRDQRRVGPELLPCHPDGPEAQYLRVTATPYTLSDEGDVLLTVEDVTVQVNVGEERRRFLVMASHQLRTPLTPIIAYAQLLKDQRLGPRETVAAAEQLVQASRNLERLFDRMALVAGLQHGPRAESHPVQVASILQEIDHLQPGILDQVSLEGDQRDLAWCHPEWISRALGELIDNGHRFGEPPVQLSWTRTNKATVFQVTDSGPGPDLRLGDQPLFGGWGEGGSDYTVPPGMGTRLGLLQARLLTEKVGGDLTFERTGRKWAFALRLPDSNTQNQHRSTQHATSVPAGNRRAGDQARIATAHV